MSEWLRIGANIASILTSIIAVAASTAFWVSKRSRRRRLENYLKAKRQKSPAEAFSTTRLMADLGMTEAEIFAASFSSRRIARGVRRDGVTGFAAEVLFRYREADEIAQPDVSCFPRAFATGTRVHVRFEIASQVPGAQSRGRLATTK